jgi:hypothetical protein
VERLGADAEVAGQRREIRLGGAGRDGGAEGVGSGDDVIHFILFLSASRSTLGSASGWSASAGWSSAGSTGGSSTGGDGTTASWGYWAASYCGERKRSAGTGTPDLGGDGHGEVAGDGIRQESPEQCHVLFGMLAGAHLQISSSPRRLFRLDRS